MKGSNDLKYKETGNDFVPMIPEDWEILKAKHIGVFQGSTVDKKIVKGEKPVRMVNFTDVYGNESMTITDEIDFMKVTAKDNQYRDFNVKIGDMLFTPSSEIREDIGQSALVKYESNDLVFSYHLIRLSFTREIDLEYKKYLFNNKATLQYFTKNCKGSTRKILGRTEFKNTPVFLPPFQTQQQIAGFLDYKCEQINRFINNKIEFIRILKEQRQSVIDRAVTKGIKSNVDLISSGYDFIGDIPKHWKIKRLGVLGSFSKGGNISRAELLYDTVGINAILYGDIYTKYDIQAKNIINQISKKTADKAIKVYYDDLLFTGSGETKEDIGKCVVVKCKEEVYAGGDVIIFRQEDNDSHFIAYSQNSSFAKYQKAISSKGDIIVHTYGSKLKNVVMPYPEIEEQKEIVKYIKEETKNIDELITKAEKEIILIKEYKESLISHAVTGQLQNINYKK